MNWLAKIPQDKLLHFIGGLGIGFLGFCGWYELAGERLAVAWGAGVLIATICGLLKETMDKRGGYGGNCDIWDLVATQTGGLVGATMGMFQILLMIH